MPEAEPPAAVDLDVVAGDMGVGVAVCEDRRLSVSKRDERAGAFHLGQRGTPEAYLSRGSAADRQAVPVEDEGLIRAKLSSRVVGEPDFPAQNGTSISRRGGKSHEVNMQATAERLLRWARASPSKRRAHRQPSLHAAADREDRRP